MVFPASDPSHTRKPESRRAPEGQADAVLASMTKMVNGGTSIAQGMTNPCGDNLTPIAGMVHDGRVGLRI